MIRLTLLAFILVADSIVAQPKAPVEAIQFDAQPVTIPGTHVIHAIAYSPDGSRLAIAGEGGEIVLVNLADRTTTQRLVGHAGTVHAIAWSKDGTRLVSAGNDKSAIVWDLATRKPSHTLKHPAALFAVALSPDGKTIATGGFDKTIRLWNADTGTEKAKREGHTASVRCLAFNANGSELASGGSDYTVRWWSMTGDTVRELRSHTKAVRTVAYVSAGRLASAGDDGRLLVWSSTEDDVLQTFGPFIDGVPSVAVSPKGTFVVAGLGMGRVQVIDPVEQQTRAVLTGGTEAVSAVAVSPNGRDIAAGSVDGTVRIWSSVSRPALPAVTYAVGVPLRASAISPDGKVVALGGSDGTIYLMDALTGNEIANWPAHQFGVEDVAFSADGLFLISGGGDRSAKVWRPSTHELLHTLKEHPGAVRRVALSPSGKLAATASSDKDVRVHDLGAGTVKTLNAEAPAVALQFTGEKALLTGGGKRAYWWDIINSRVLETLDGGQFALVTSVAGTQDELLFAVTGDPAPGTVLPEYVGFSRVLAVSRHHATAEHQRLSDTGVGVSRVAIAAKGRIISVVGGDGVVRAWEWPSGNPIRKFPAHAAPVPGLAISSGGEFLVTASSDGTARRWNASRGDPLIYAAKLLDESSQAWFARLSPDGKTLITGGDDKVLRVRDGVPGNFATLPGTTQAATASAVSPDGTLLATGHFDGGIRIWDVPTNKLVKQLKGPGFRVYALAFSPDGTRLVSGGGNYSQAVAGELNVWDTATWKSVHSLPAHDQMIYDVAVSPDGKRIATASQDHTVRLWDMATGNEVHVLRMHAAAVKSLAFTKDGKRLYSGGFDGRLHWWDPEAGKWIDGRDLKVGSVARMRLSPDGTTLGLALNAGTNFGYPALWDIEKNDVTHKFANHSAVLTDVAFSPDGKTLVSAGGLQVENPPWEAGPHGPWFTNVTTKLTDGKTATLRVATSEIHCWDVETQRPLADLPGTKHRVESIVFTPDGSRLVSTSGFALTAGEVRIHDFAGIRPKAVLAGSEGALTCGKFNPDGSLFATGGSNGTLIVWNVAKALAADATAKRVVPAHKGNVRNLVWSSDGKRLFTSGDDGRVRAWDAKTLEPSITFTAADRSVYGIAVSPDGTMIATAAGDWKDLKSGQVRGWDAAKGIELFRLPETTGPAWGVAFTADGLLIAAQIGETPVRVFDIKMKKEVKALTAATDARGLSLSPDGKRFGITSQANGLVKIWDTGMWREAFEVVAHPGKVVFSIDFASDGQTVLTAGGDRAVVVWKIPGGTWKLPDRVPPEPAPGLPKGPPPQFNK